MKKEFLIGVAAALIAAPALAGDLPSDKGGPVYMAPPTWAGLYVGANLGAVGSTGNSSFRCVNSFGGTTGCPIIPNLSLDSTGFLGGVQAGYNWQSGNFVYGLESDFDGSSLIVKKAVAGPFPLVGGGTTGAATFSSKEILNSLGTIRARVGLSRGATLFYVTGGLAYGSVQLENNIFDPLVAYPNSADEILAGWTAGGGVEWAFMPHWSVRAEGLYYDLGDYTLTTAVGKYTAGSRFSVNGWVARAGLNYNFGEPPVLAKY